METWSDEWLPSWVTSSVVRDLEFVAAGQHAMRDTGWSGYPLILCLPPETSSHDEMMYDRQFGQSLRITTCPRPDSRFISRVASACGSFEFFFRGIYPPLQPCLHNWQGLHPGLHAVHRSLSFVCFDLVYMKNIESVTFVKFD